MHWRQAPAEKLTPGGQEVQTEGFVAEQVLQVESQGTQELLCRAYPEVQAVQTVAEVQVEHPLGQTILCPPTMALEVVVEGLLTHWLEESRE